MVRLGAQNSCSSEASKKGARQRNGGKYDFDKTKVELIAKYSYTLKIRSDNTKLRLTLALPAIVTGDCDYLRSAKRKIRRLALLSKLIWRWFICVKRKMYSTENSKIHIKPRSSTLNITEIERTGMLNNNSRVRKTNYVMRNRRTKPTVRFIPPVRTLNNIHQNMSCYRVWRIWTWIPLLEKMQIICNKTGPTIIVKI